LALVVSRGLLASMPAGPHAILTLGWGVAGIATAGHAALSVT